MKRIDTDILIIGAGLTGLTLAYLLREKNYRIHIVEARERIGGRIFTSYQDGSASLEMGATWLGTKHTRLNALLAALGLKTFEQALGEKAIYEPLSTSPPQLVTLPAGQEASYRIQGGSSALIHALAAKIPKVQVHLGEKVSRIEEAENSLQVHTDTLSFHAGKVISTLPPFLFHSSITTRPALPLAFSEIAEQTHTWMGESIKVGFRYKAPFWRAANSSGTIFSNVGPLNEFYDHANAEDTGFALKGFLNSAFHTLTQDERRQRALAQLKRYYGEQAGDFLSYEEVVWREEAFTFSSYPAPVFPHQFNGDPVYREGYLGDKLMVAGSETSAEFPGYMEGAVRSAEYVAGWLNR